MSLPGDRQGTSGAGAGRDSIRDVGDGELSRRASIAQEATAENPEVPDGLAVDNNVPTLDTNQATPPATRRGRRRFKWTDEINEFLYRTYLIITRMETSNEPYGSQLHRTVIEKFPELNGKTLQNILDQRRILFTKNRLNPNRISLIRTEVKRELGLEPADTEVGQPAMIEVVSEEEQKLQDQFNHFHILYNGIDPTHKPRLPKLRPMRNTKKIVEIIDKIVSQLMTDEQNITDLHSIIYTAAITTLHAHNQEPINADRLRPIRTAPSWDIRISKRIECLRRELGKITQYRRQLQPKRKLTQEVEEICQKYRGPEATNHTEVLDLINQKLQVHAKKLRRYRLSYSRKTQNRLFCTSQRQFYSQLTRTSRSEHEEVSLPSDADILSFWNEIWGNTQTHNPTTTWIKAEKKRTEKVPVMFDHEVTLDEVKKAIRKTHNWKATGCDNIHNYWYKAFTSTHPKLAKFFTHLILHPQETPRFFTQGITYLLPKTDKPHPNPGKYRPITCLPTIYKILTSILASKINTHVERYSLLAEEQKGCRRKAQGCKEQLIIDKALTQHAKKTKSPLNVAYIDYQKAFDSVPHSWLAEVLKVYKIDPIIVTFLSTNMERWNTELKLSLPERTRSIGGIDIRRGIFQGDALSPLWFCLALNPLSETIKKSTGGYPITPQISLTHLLYMDDLKLYAASRKELDKALKITSQFSTDIGMKFGLDKCRINAMRKGKWAEDQAYRVDEGEIESMTEEELYKYLGHEQTCILADDIVKNNAIDRMKRRMKLILKSNLSAQNKAKAVNTYAIPVVGYTFGACHWTQTELDALDRQTRTLFTKYRAHHPKSSVERFHLPRSYGGRGILNLSALYGRQISSLHQYFTLRAQSSNIHAAVVSVDRNLTPLHLDSPLTDQVPQTQVCRQQIQQWKAKPLHGKYPNLLSTSHINREASLGWLKHGNLFSETEGFIIAIQDRVIATRNYMKHVVQDMSVTSDRCRACSTTAESVEHIISGCPILAPTEYTRRHDNVAKIIHQAILTTIEPNSKPVAYYGYQPEAVITTDHYTLYWNRTIHTDRQIQHNRPDIVLIKKQDKHTYLVDIAIPHPENIVSKHNEKTAKYLPLADEVKEMWHQEEVTIVPVLIGATGEIPASLFTALRTLNLKEKLYLQMQKSVVLDTCSMVRRFLNFK